MKEVNPFLMFTTLANRLPPALQAYQDEVKAAQELRKKKPLKPISKDAAMAAVAAAERKAQLVKLALEAAQHEADRVRLEQIEKQKNEERERESQRMSEEQRAARRAEAQKLAAQALAYYNQGDYKNAEADFKKTPRSWIQRKQGLLLQIRRFALSQPKVLNEALVILEVIQSRTVTRTRAQVLHGPRTLSRLSELDNALKDFSEVGKSKDPNMGPSATFYEGVILFAQEKFEPSKKAFETVIDTSKDPKLDDQAEGYLDKIAAAMAFQKLRENKIHDYGRGRRDV